MAGNFTLNKQSMSRFTQVRPIQNVRHGIHLFKNRKTLWQMIREVLSGNYKMSALTTLVVFISVIYVVDPFDLIPDFIPIIGWTDDALIVYLLLKRLVKETQRYTRFKAMERRGN